MINQPGQSALPHAVDVPILVAEAAHDWALTTIDQMSLPERVGQLFVNFVYGSTADTADPLNIKRYGVATPAEVVQKYRLGGVIYFAWAGNVTDVFGIPELSNGLQRAARAGSPNTEIPLHIGIDQETGLVARIAEPVTEFPGAMALGAARDPAATESSYAIIGKELRALGINANYVPNADVKVNPANPIIGVRSFSAHPDLVAELVPASIAGLQRNQVSAIAKHFPGHGNTDVDSHTGFPVIPHTRAQWEEIDAPPFRAAIRAGTDMIMTAHVSVPSLDPSGTPATMSAPIIDGVLRGELGYDGVVVTDSLRMAAVAKKYPDDQVVVRALQAGVDVLLDACDPDGQYHAVLRAVDSGLLTEARINESVRRILTAKYRRGLVAHSQADPALARRVIGSPQHRLVAQQITDRTTTVLTDRAKQIPLSAQRVLVVGIDPRSVATLADALAAHGIATTVQQTGRKPDPAVIARAVAAGRRNDLVVVITNDVAAHPEQATLVAALAAAGIAYAVVATGAPHDIAYLNVGTYLATYAGNDVAMRSAARVLTGAVRSSGRLPVDIPDEHNPAIIRYPFGSGQ